jgi:hypothetical protein
VPVSGIHKSFAGDASQVKPGGEAGQFSPLLLEAQQEHKVGTGQGRAIRVQREQAAKDRETHA